jgi:hypothetical protein
MAQSNVVKLPTKLYGHLSFPKYMSDNKYAVDEQERIGVPLTTARHDQGLSTRWA